MSFLSRICILCTVSRVVGNVWEGNNGNGLHNLVYLFSRASSTFWWKRWLMFGLLLFQHGNKIIIEQVLVGFYSSTWISLFYNRLLLLLLFYFFSFRKSLIQIYRRLPTLNAGQCYWVYVFGFFRLYFVV
jgi:hypothetical protein